MKKLDVLEVVDQTVQLLQLGKIGESFLVTFGWKKRGKDIFDCRRMTDFFMLWRMWRKMLMDRKKKSKITWKAKNHGNNFGVACRSFLLWFGAETGSKTQDECSKLSSVSLSLEENGLWHMMTWLSSGSDDSKMEEKWNARRLVIWWS